VHLGEFAAHRSVGEARGGDLIENMIDAEIEGGARQLDMLERKKEVCQLALEILDAYTYRVDSPKAMLRTADGQVTEITIDSIFANVFGVESAGDKRGKR